MSSPDSLPTASPRRGGRYIWFVDAGIATNGVNPQLRDDPRARRYLGGSAGFTLKDVGAYLGAQATRAAWRVVLKCVVGSCRPNVRYNPDGSIPHSALTNLPEHAKNLQADVAKLVQSIRDHPPRSVSVDPRRYVHFEKALAFMNAHGSTPVIVLNPIYPSILRELEKYGFPERRASLEYLGKLHRRFKFVVVNAEDIRSWGGSPQNFANATHIDWVNMRRLLKYIASRPGTPLR